jgi:hypothetical protein
MSRSQSYVAPFAFINSRLRIYGCLGVALCTFQINANRCILPVMLRNFIATISLKVSYQKKMRAVYVITTLSD